MQEQVGGGLLWSWGGTWHAHQSCLRRGLTSSRVLIHLGMAVCVQSKMLIIAGTTGLVVNTVILRWLLTAIGETKVLIVGEAISSSSNSPASLPFLSPYLPHAQHKLSASPAEEAHSHMIGNLKEADLKYALCMTWSRCGLMMHPWCGKSLDWKPSTAQAWLCPQCSSWRSPLPAPRGCPLRPSPPAPSAT